MKFKRSWKAAAVSTMLCFGLVATAASTAASASSKKPHSGGQYVGIQASFATFDPASPGWLASTSQIGWAVYGDLFLQLQKGVFSPDLANSWRVTNKGLRVTMALRPNLRFQDGTALNAQAVVYNIQRQACVTCSSLSTEAGYLQDISKVVAVGKTTVVMTLKQPDANLQDVFTETSVGMIGSPTAIQNEGASFGIQPVGAGPFRMTAMNPNVSTTLNRWSGYWDSKHTYVSSMVFNAIGGDDQIYAALASGASDQGSFSPWSSPGDIQSAIASPALSRLAPPQLSVTFLQENTFKAPFNNPLAREAVAYCTDRQTLATSVENGYGVPAYYFAGPSEDYFPGYKPPSSIPWMTYNLSEGTSLVKQIPGGISFQIIPVAAITGVLNLVGALEKEWAQCGIKTTTSIVAHTTQVLDLADGNFQMVLSVNGNYYNPYISVGLFSLPTTAYDIYGFNDATVNNLLAETGFSGNPAIQARRWLAVWEREDQLGVNLPILTQKPKQGLVFVNKAVHGMAFNGSNLYVDNVWLS